MIIWMQSTQLKGQVEHRQQTGDANDGVRNQSRRVQKNIWFRKLWPEGCGAATIQWDKYAPKSTKKLTVESTKKLTVETL